MEIRATRTVFSDVVYETIYRDADDVSILEGKPLTGSGAHCFFGDRFVLVHKKVKGNWVSPGGGIEPGESAAQTMVREVKEESNMRVLDYRFFGYEEFFPVGQGGPSAQPTAVVAYFVAIVEPFGDFVSDPDGDIDAVKLIDPKDYKLYFDWGKAGDREMERALEIKPFLKASK